jgi:hypothetical protein
MLEASKAAVKPPDLPDGTETKDCAEVDVRETKEMTD